jgi:hypothetical protein
MPNIKSYKLGTLIARRELYLAGGQKIAIRIGKPQRSLDRRSYFCPYEILGLGDDQLRRAPGGLDSVHAIQLVLQKIGIDLYVLNDAHEGALRWDAGDNGDLGFPLPDNLMSILKT